MFSLHGDYKVPVGPYETFGECVGAQTRKGYTQEEAGGICGKIEKGSMRSTRSKQAVMKLRQAQTSGEYEDPVIWWSVLDDRTCTVCEALHGDVYERFDAENHFPAHINCRCELMKELTDPDVYGKSEDNWIIPVAFVSTIAADITQTYEDTQDYNAVLPSSTRPKPKAKTKPSKLKAKLESIGIGIEARESKVINTKKPIEVIPQSKEDEGRLFIKTFLIDASLSGNAWGVTRESIAQNIQSFIGKPLVLFMDKQGELDHPPEHDAHTAAEWAAFQEPFRIGTIVDVINKPQFSQSIQDDQFYAIIEVTDKNAKEILQKTQQTLYVSPGIADFARSVAVNNKGIPVGEVSTQWVGMHLALVRQPAYGIKKAGIISKCGGSEEACIAQLRKARLLKANCGFCVRTALLGRVDTSQVTSKGTIKSLRLSSQDLEIKQAQGFEACVRGKVDGGMSQADAEEACSKIAEGKKAQLETNPLEEENQRLKQEIAKLETKISEVGEQKSSLTQRIASLEEREISRVLEAKILDEPRRKEKIKLYMAKHLSAEEVEDLYKDFPTPQLQTRKARLETQAEGRAALGSTQEDTSDQNLRTRKTMALLHGGVL